jgi:membrane protease subunit (stomatin/prohibitin family)
VSDIQTKIGGGLNKLQGSLQQGKQKLQTVQEISQYRKVIQENGEKRASIILALGEAAFKKMRAGELQDVELHELTQKVLQFDQEIFKAQKAVEKLARQAKQENGCPSCGATVTENDKFCGSCGQKVEAVNELVDEETEQCRVCEEEIPVSSKYCICCGTQQVG